MRVVPAGSEEQLMQQIIDRRLAGKNKSIGNRERFLRRHKEQIREAVKRAIDGRSIKDIERGEDIHIPKRDLSEPVFGHGAGGTRETVHPGNQDYLKGDRIERPKGRSGGKGAGKGQAGDSGEGDDDFVFSLSKEEFMQVFFDDLALPHLVRTQLAELPEWKYHRAGYSSDGTPNNLHVVRSMRGAIGRRIAIGASSRRSLRELEEELARLLALPPLADAIAQAQTQTQVQALQAEIAALTTRVARIPYLDPIDLRYRSRVKTPVPTSKAVMFCLMDVSGSMTQATKDIAKRFFILLYLFLKRNYDKIDVVFIRHHTSAREVDEEEFFYSRETGGTIVSSALKLMQEIMAERYPANEWNIYAAQASDGDNWNDDSPICRDILINQIMPFVQYYTYVEITPREHQALWFEYERIGEAFADTFAQQQLVSAGDIYPVFRELFQRRLVT